MRASDDFANLGRYARADAVLLIGRMLMSIIFIGSGWERVEDFDSAAGYLKGLGMPFPEVLNAIEIVIEGLGGVALLTGLLFRLATLGIIASTIIASFVAHHFWTMHGPQGLDNYFHFMKNACIVGGLLYFNIHGPGRFSLSRMWDGEKD